MEETGGKKEGMDSMKRVPSLRSGQVIIDFGIDTKKFSQSECPLAPPKSIDLSKEANVPKIKHLEEERKNKLKQRQNMNLMSVSSPTDEETPGTLQTVVEYDDKKDIFEDELKKIGTNGEEEEAEDEGREKYRDFEKIYTELSKGHLEKDDEEEKENEGENVEDGEVDKEELTEEEKQRFLKKLFVVNKHHITKKEGKEGQLFGSKYTKEELEKEYENLPYFLKEHMAYLSQKTVVFERHGPYKKASLILKPKDSSHIYQNDIDLKAEEEKAAMKKAKEEEEIQKQLEADAEEEKKTEQEGEKEESGDGESLSINIKENDALASSPNKKEAPNSPGRPPLISIPSTSSMGGANKSEDVINEEDYVELNMDYLKVDEERLRQYAKKKSVNPLQRSFDMIEHPGPVNKWAGTEERLCGRVKPVRQPKEENNYVLSVERVVRKNGVPNALEPLFFAFCLFEAKQDMTNNRPEYKGQLLTEFFHVDFNSPEMLKSLHVHQNEQGEKVIDPFTTLKHAIMPLNIKEKQDVHIVGFMYKVLEGNFKKRFTTKLSDKQILKMERILPPVWPALGKFRQAVGWTMAKVFDEGEKDFDQKHIVLPFYQSDGNISMEAIARHIVNKDIHKKYDRILWDVECNMFHLGNLGESKDKDIYDVEIPIMKEIPTIEVNSPSTPSTPENGGDSSIDDSTYYTDSPTSMVSGTPIKDYKPSPLAKKGTPNGFKQQDETKDTLKEDDEKVVDDDKKDEALKVDEKEESIVETPKKENEDEGETPKEKAEVTEEEKTTEEKEEPKEAVTEPNTEDVKEPDTEEEKVVNDDKEEEVLKTEEKEDLVKTEEKEEPTTRMVTAKYLRSLNTVVHNQFYNECHHYYYILPTAANLNCSEFKRKKLFKKNPSFRNICVKIQVTYKGENLKCIVGRTSEPYLVDTYYTTVAYHNQTPSFSEVIKLKLPAVVTKDHYVQFTFMHIVCQNRKKIEAVHSEHIKQGKKPVKRFAEMAVTRISLINDRAIREGEEKMVLYHLKGNSPDEKRQTYRRFDPHDPCGEELNKGGPMFWVRLVNGSSMYSHHSFIADILHTWQTVEDLQNISLKSQMANLKDYLVNEKSVSAIKSVLPLVLNQIIKMMCHNGYLELQQIAFETFMNIVKVCSNSYKFNLIWEYIYYLYDAGESSSYQLEGTELSFEHMYLGEATPSTPVPPGEEKSASTTSPKKDAETNGTKPEEETTAKAEETVNDEATNGEANKVEKEEATTEEKDEKEEATKEENTVEKDEKPKKEEDEETPKENEGEEETPKENGDDNKEEKKEKPKAETELTLPSDLTNRNFISNVKHVKAQPKIMKIEITDTFKTTAAFNLPFIWVKQVEKNVTQDNCEYSWVYYDIIVKSLTLHISRLGGLEASKKRFQHDEYTQIIGELVKKHGQYVYKNQNVTNTSIKRRQINNYTALFLRDMLDLYDRGDVFYWIDCYLSGLTINAKGVKFNRGGSTIFDHRIEFLTILADYDYFLPLSNPDGNLTHFDYADSLCNTHYLCGLVLRHGSFQLFHNSRIVRKQFINLVRNMIAKHEYDEIFSVASENISLLYFDFVFILLNNIYFYQQIASSKFNNLNTEQKLLQCDEQISEAHSKIMPLKNKKQKNEQRFYKDKSFERELIQEIETLEKQIENYKAEKKRLLAQYEREYFKVVNEGRSLLICVIWVVKHMNRKLLLDFLLKSNAKRVTRFLYMMLSVIKIFEYKGEAKFFDMEKSRVDLKKQPAHKNHHYAANKLARSGQGRRREAVKDRNAQLNTTKAVLGIKLKWEKALCGDAVNIALDFIHDFLCTYQNKKSEQIQIFCVPIFDIFNYMMTNYQNYSESTLKIMLHMLRKLFELYSKPLFVDVDNSFCATITTNLMRLCYSQLKSIRELSTAILYSLFKKNYLKMGDMLRTQTDSTLSLSKLVTDLNENAVSRLKATFNGITAYAKEDTEAYELNTSTIRNRWKNAEQKKRKDNYTNSRVGSKPQSVSTPSFKSNAAFTDSFEDLIRDLMSRLNVTLHFTKRVTAIREDDSVPENEVANTMLTISHQCRHTPRESFSWLEQLFKEHQGKRNYVEAAQVGILMAAHIFKFFASRKNHHFVDSTFIEQTSTFNSKFVAKNNTDLRYQLLRSTSPSLDQFDFSEFTRYIEFDKDFNMERFDEEGYLSTLKEAIKLFNKAKHYEYAIPLYKILGLYYEREERFDDLKDVHVAMADQYSLIHNAYNKSRHFAYYYKITFIGALAGSENGREYIHKFNSTNGIVRLQTVKEYVTKYVPHQLKIDRAALAIESESFKITEEVKKQREKLYVIITFVNPYNPPNTIPLHRADGNPNFFLSNTNVNRFSFVASTTPNKEALKKKYGKARWNSYAFTWRYKKIWHTKYPFPSLLTTSVILHEKTERIEWNPLQTACIEIESAIDRLEQLCEEPIAISPLHQKIKGVIAPEVNAGISKYVTTFLRTKNSNEELEYWDVISDYYTEKDADVLKNLLKRFMEVGRYSITVSVSYHRYQSHDLIKHFIKCFNEMHSQFSEYLDLEDIKTLDPDYDKNGSI